VAPWLNKIERLTVVRRRPVNSWHAGWERERFASKGAGIDAVSGSPKKKPAIGIDAGFPCLLAPQLLGMDFVDE
jgi:hypothetical protein